MLNQEFLKSIKIQRFIRSFDLLIYNTYGHEINRESNSIEWDIQGYQLAI